MRQSVGPASWNRNGNESTLDELPNHSQGFAPDDLDRRVRIGGKYLYRLLQRAGAVARRKKIRDRRLQAKIKREPAYEP